MPLCITGADIEGERSQPTPAPRPRPARAPTMPAARHAVAGFPAVSGALAGATFGVMKSVPRLPLRAMLPIAVAAIAAVAAVTVQVLPTRILGFTSPTKAVRL